jgi:hypothetical protein
MTARILLLQVAANRSLPWLPNCCSHLLWTVSNKLQDACLPFLPNLVPEWRGKKKFIIQMCICTLFYMTKYAKDDGLTIYMKPTHWWYQKYQKANQRFRSRMASSKATSKDNHQAQIARYLDSTSSIILESLYCLQRRLFWSCMSGLINFYMCRFRDVV